jgi:hypothetical protein
VATRITLRNYRCFVAPAVFEFAPGFTAFVGVNNAGKSALIRFLVEFRQLFEILQHRDILSNRLSDKGAHSLVTPLAGTLRPSELLGELSFSSQKEMGLNQILLVEGPTEVKVIQQLLRTKHKDHLIVLLPMYGHMPDEVELDEVLRITPNIAALIDSEKASEGSRLEPKRQAVVDLFRRKQLKIHVLERRATENYFTDGAIKQTFGANFRALGPFEKLSDVNPHWGKGQNWQLASASAEVIYNTDLGRFLSSL